MQDDQKSDAAWGGYTPEMMRQQYRYAYKIGDQHFYAPFPNFDPDEPSAFRSANVVPFYDKSIEACMEPFGYPDAYHFETLVDPRAKVKHQHEGKLEVCRMAPGRLRDGIYALTELMRDEEYPAVRAAAREAFSLMTESIGHELAKNPENLEILKDFALTLAEYLDRLVQSHPEESQRIARATLYWPKPLSPRKNQQKRAAEQLEEIELGRDLIANPSVKGADLAKSANAFADGLIQYVDRLRRVRVNGKHWYKVGGSRIIPVPVRTFKKIRALDDFNSSNVDIWFETCWETLLHFTKGEPQTYANLEELGEFRVEEAKSRTEGSLSPESEESYRKEGIRKALKQAFQTIGKQRG